MILIVGGTGTLGSTVARSLLARGERVRVMARDSVRLRDLEALGAEIVAGDVRDPSALALACDGAHTLIAAFHGFMAGGQRRMEQVDSVGIRNVINAASAAGVDHFIFTSIQGARADHPLALFRLKHQAESYLRASRLHYTIVRPTAFMELWAALIGDPILSRGATTIFGRGTNPINFVAATDVAQLILLALDTFTESDRVIEIGGPENLTFEQVAATFERVAGRSASKRHVPLPVLRSMSRLLRPVAPVLARQMQTAIFMDTANLRFDASDTLARYPLRLTSLEELARSRAGRASSLALTN